jgi:hypothetical protein
LTRLSFLLAIIGTTASAQWVNIPGGKPNLSAPAPRVPSGKPDLSGVWHEVGQTADGADASPYAFNIFFDLKPEEIPERPQAAQVRSERMKSGVRENPSVHCLPHGIPLHDLLTEAVKIVQTPGLIVIIYEVDGTYRQIYTDGRRLEKDPQPAWMGYSTGRWEGDTLVVDTSGFNDKAWIDLMGHSHSEALRVTERYRRVDFGHLNVEMTFDDPKMYTRPFTIKFTHLLQPQYDVQESFCNENEKDRTHLGIK